MLACMWVLGAQAGRTEQPTYGLLRHRRVALNHVPLAHLTLNLNFAAAGYWEKVIKDLFSSNDAYLYA